MYICKSLTKKKEDVVLKKFRETDFTKFFVRLISQKKKLYMGVSEDAEIFYFSNGLYVMFFSRMRNRCLRNRFSTSKLCYFTKFYSKIILEVRRF